MLRVFLKRTDVKMMFEFPLQEVGGGGGILMKRDATLCLHRRNSCRIPAARVEVHALILSPRGESFPPGFAGTSTSHVAAKITAKIKSVSACFGSSATCDLLLLVD